MIMAPMDGRFLVITLMEPLTQLPVQRFPQGMVRLRPAMEPLAPIRLMLHRLAMAFPQQLLRPVPLPLPQPVPPVPTTGCSSVFGNLKSGYSAWRLSDINPLADL